MSAVWILLRKDLQSFFGRPLFYLIAGLCTLVWSPIYIYAFGVFLSQVVTVLGAGGEYISFQERVVTDFVSLVNFMIILFVNGITMRLLAEERKNGTMYLLMTSPLRSWQIVLAKCLAGYIVVALLIFISFLYPLTTSFLGHVHWGALVASYVGLLLFAAVYVAVGVLASAMTQSALMAFLFALILNLSLWFIGVGADLGLPDAWGAFFDYVNLEGLFKSFAGGVIRLSAVVYLVSLAVGAAVGAERVLETSRWR